VADFAARDPATSAFWDERYRAGFTPWDARGVPPALVRFLESSPPGRRVLVPGCGSAYEAGYLHHHGFDVMAIDIAPVALARAREVLGGEVADRVLRQADFFTLDDEFDWIYERALLCALPPRLWPDYGAAVSRLLRPGGLLAGFFFVDDAAGEPRRGPPFAAHRAEIDGLFRPGFDRTADDEVPTEQSLPVFARRERWMTWQRRDTAAGAAKPPGVAS
jgi:SAM-dependent methyltransferase